MAALIQALVVLALMSAAGALHVLWLRSPRSRRFAWAVDGGLHFRGRRLFGDNKRLCGFMALPPAAGLFFFAFGALREHMPEAIVDATWALHPLQYGLLGLACGLAFMLAELPNSFVKRQLDVPPGEAPRQPSARMVTAVTDRVDSVLGVLLILTLLVPVHAGTWLWVLLFGPGLHAGFSLLLYRLGLKARAA